MLAQSCMFWVICCFVGLTHPTACTRARAPRLLDMSTDPPLTQLGCQSTGLLLSSKLRIPLIYLKFCRSGPENLWRSHPKNSDPPPPPSADRTHTYTNRKLLTKGIQICHFYSDMGMPSKSCANGRLLHMLFIQYSVTCMISKSPQFEPGIAHKGLCIGIIDQNF